MGDLDGRPVLGGAELTLDEVVTLARRFMISGGRMLGIAGPPASGKSTLAAAVASALAPDATIVPADGFHLANRVLRDMGKAQTKGAPDTFDVAGFRHLLGRIAARTEDVVYAPEFVRSIEEPIAAAIAVGAGTPLVIVEGNYLAMAHGPWEGTSQLLDEVWYIDVDPELRRKRLLARRIGGGQDPEDAQRWTYGSDETNARIVESSRSSADRMVRLVGSEAAVPSRRYRGTSSTPEGPGGGLPLAGP